MHKVMQRYAKQKSTDGGTKYRTTLYLERALVQHARAIYPSVSHLINDMLRSILSDKGLVAQGQSAAFARQKPRVQLPPSP